ncbi:barstar family protein [Paractinoplanes toevensis]|uniref:Barnase inhibitor n=1 Tax=Paractinoplanes toevensis TaxID=571911 RepID=A0A919W8W4_9ACTN|nr:barstar family protein [Actinoplanes toevensis]GIM95754.1 barnase inhibitor [Actinoplanes toevensis]
MVSVTIPGNRIVSELELHRFLARELDLGPYYGKNLDALWDRLTTDVERPVYLVWVDAAKSREGMGEDLFDKIVDLLRKVAAKDVEAGYKDRFNVEIRE